MNAIIKTWQRLNRLNHLVFVSRPGPQSKTGWAGTGHADIQTETVSENCLRLIENGTFQPTGASRALTFRNVYRWQLQDNALWLSHERFGAETPVFLVCLVADTAQRLTSEQAHLCGEDRYHLELGLTDDGMTLDWRITGPVKDEQLAYRYGTGEFGRGST